MENCSCGKHHQCYPDRKVKHGNSRPDFKLQLMDLAKQSIPTCSPLTCCTRQEQSGRDREWRSCDMASTAKEWRGNAAENTTSAVYFCVLAITEWHAHVCRSVHEQHQIPHHYTLSVFCVCVVSAAALDRNMFPHLDGTDTLPSGPNM